MVRLPTRAAAGDAPPAAHGGPSARRRLFEGAAVLRETSAIHARRRRITAAASMATGRHRASRPRTRTPRRAVVEHARRSGRRPTSSARRARSTRPSAKLEAAFGGRVQRRVGHRLPGRRRRRWSPGEKFMNATTCARVPAALLVATQRAQALARQAGGRRGARAAAACPRVGPFEVSYVVIDGDDQAACARVFAKLVSGTWPNLDKAARLDSGGSTRARSQARRRRGGGCAGGAREGEAARSRARPRAARARRLAGAGAFAAARARRVLQPRARRRIETAVARASTRVKARVGPSPARGAFKTRRASCAERRRSRTPSFELAGGRVPPPLARAQAAATAPASKACRAPR